MNDAFSHLIDGAHGWLWKLSRAMSFVINKARCRGLFCLSPLGSSPETVCKFCTHHSSMTSFSYLIAVSGGTLLYDENRGEGLPFKFGQRYPGVFGLNGVTTLPLEIEQGKVSAG